MARGHAEAVMPLIARVMDAADAEFAELDRIAVTVGPGSFTGLRVGISAARGIALAAGRPAIGLSTLSALRRPPRSPTTTPSVAAIDARNEQVYFQVFGPNGARWSRRGSPRARAVRAVPVGPDAIVGSGRCWSRRPGRADAAAAPVPRIRRRPTSAGSRGSAPPRRRSRPAQAALSAPARCAAAGRRPPAAPMIGMLARLFGRGEPALSRSRRHATRQRLAALHARLVPSRLERRRIRAAAPRPQRDRAPRRPSGRERCRLHPVAARRGRGRDPFDRGRVVGAGKGWRGAARSASAPPGRLGVRAVFLEVDRRQRASAPALCACRLPRGRPAGGYYPQVRAARRWCCGRDLVGCERSPIPGMTRSELP